MPGKKESISVEQAIKLVLHSQKLPPANPQGSAIAATLTAIEHLGYIQIDTISVIQRAHHHTLWSRNPRYKKDHLSQLVADRKVFEYWSHAAAYLPMRDYRFSLYRKQAIASGRQNHWFNRDEKLMDSVLKRIREEGPLMAKDFVHNGDKMGEWQSKPTKQALENLFMQGDLMISERKSFHKVYDLTERVLPPNINTSTPSPKEFARYLITRYLKANGLGQASEITYLLRNIKPVVATTMEEMVENGELLRVAVGEHSFFALPDALELLNKPLSRSKLKILSPFDNLVIQRKRMLALFDFDYQIECYVPKAKRQYGYFSLPVLWDGKLAARMDCKADRKTSTLHLRHLALEPRLRKIEAFARALGKELIPFMQFNACEHIRLHKTTPQENKPELEKIIDRINP